ncbi:MAG: response regulator transcription factor [Oscillospiraceae bacterium]|nr:response regulator transcription factor [Oscillospiraceae bacterium]
MKYRILLVEDEVKLLEIIEDYLTTRPDHEITLICAQDGATALEYLQTQQFDLVILDVMLPDIDGFSICRELRAYSDVPILFLTARCREEDQLYGYALGCDDYLLKPFSLAVLYAKITALLKRSKETAILKQLQYGAIAIDLLAMEVTVNGEIITLAPKEYALLKYLMEHKNWVVSRDTLLEKVWGYDYYGGERVVDNHIKKLRHALGPAGNQIKTVIGKGYRFVEAP